MRQKRQIGGMERPGKMNQRGIFMSFMVFLLVSSFLAVHEVAKRTDFWQEQGQVNSAAFNKVNNTFNNIYEEVVSLNKEGFAKMVQQRSMPFQYDFNGNSITISQRLPIRSSTMLAYIDALNIYSIFANEESTPDLNIATSTVKNPLWDPGLEQNPELSYVILPQCLSYDLNSGGSDRNYMMVREIADGENNCVGGFDYNSLKAVDINILLKTEAYISQTPPITGTLDKQEDFNSQSGLPYARITINEIRPECPGLGCVVTENGEYKMHGHFNPLDFNTAGSRDWLLIHANETDVVRVKLGKEHESDVFPVAIYNTLPTSPVEVDLNMTFGQKPELFYFTGFTVSVEKKNFPIQRST